MGWLVGRWYRGEETRLGWGEEERVDLDLEKRLLQSQNDGPSPSSHPSPLPSKVDSKHCLGWCCPCESEGSVSYQSRCGGCYGPSWSLGCCPSSRRGRPEPLGPVQPLRPSNPHSVRVRVLVCGGGWGGQASSLSPCPVFRGLPGCPLSSAPDHPWASGAHPEVALLGGCL